MNDKKRLQYEGQVFSTNNYGDLTIVKYEDAHHVHVKFLNTGNVGVADIANIKNGRVCDNMFKNGTATVLGIGKIGFGKYSKATHKDIYVAWTSMLRRCYSKKAQKYGSCYVGCSVCEEWHVFQNFASWYEGRYSDVCTDVDKDILVKNNRVYSPNTCCVVPNAINNVMIQQRNHRGELPIGVFLIKRNATNGKRMYGAQCSDKSSVKRGYVGRYDTPEEAFEAYKRAKEKHVKALAEQYKSVLEPRVYDALMKFSVDIND